MTSPDQPSPANDEIDFAPFGFMQGNTPVSRMNIDISRFLLSVWKPLIVGGCLGGLIGIGVYLYLGPVYSANTQISVSKKASVPTGDREANRYGDRGDHVELIKSDLIIEPAFKKHGLNEVPELAGAYDPLKDVRESLSVDRSSGRENSFDNIFDVSFVHPDKQIAAKVVQAVIDSYRDYLLETKDENSKQVYQNLLDRQKDLAKEISDLETDYRKFRTDAPVFLKASPVVLANGNSLPPQSRYETELASLESEQNENQIRQTGIQAKLNELERRKARGDSAEQLEFWVTYSLSTGVSSGKSSTSSGGASALSGPPVKSSLDQQFLTARLLEERLLHSLGEEHSDVRKVRRQIDTILDSYSQQGLTPPTYQRSSSSSNDTQTNSAMDIVSVYEDTLQSQLAELQTVAKNLEIMRSDAEGKAKEAELYQVQDQRLKDEIGVKKTQLTQIFNQIASYDLSRAQEGYQFKQIAQVRIERSLKRVIKIVGMFGFLGVGFVFVLSYFREWLDTRIKSIDELCKLTDTPLLGSVPMFVSTPDADRLAQSTGLSPELVFYHRPGSREAEAFRSIRTTLFHGFKQNEKVLQISSAEPGDGKSTIAANIALAMAQAGKKVLLVDFDLRCPKQHELFGITQDSGIADVLLSEVQWQNVIRSTPVESLSLIPAGRHSGNPAELLTKQNISDLLREMRSEYDLVILDSPPILAVSDPTILCPYVDGISLVSRIMKNKRATAARMMQTLAVHGARCFGIIANGIDPKSAAESGYSYESYESYYSENTPTVQSNPKTLIPQ